MPAYPLGTGPDGSLTPSEKYTHDMAVAAWTSRKQETKTASDEFHTQNSYLFNLLMDSEAHLSCDFGPDRAAMRRLNRLEF